MQHPKAAQEINDRAEQQNQVFRSRVGTTKKSTVRICLNELVLLMLLMWGDRRLNRQHGHGIWRGKGRHLSNFEPIQTNKTSRGSI